MFDIISKDLLNEETARKGRCIYHSFYPLSLTFAEILYENTLILINTELVAYSTDSPFPIGTSWFITFEFYQNIKV